MRALPTLAIGPTPSEGAEGRPTVFFASNTTLDRFVCVRDARFRRIRCTCRCQDTDVLRQVQWQSHGVTNCWIFLAVARDDVASIRIHNCNMALTVNFSCENQSFANICFPASHSHCIPTLSRSLHAQAATVGDEFLPEAVL